MTLAWVPLLLVSTLAAGGYLALVSRWRSRRGRTWSPWRATWWLTGVALAAAAAAPPISAAAHHDPVVHMTQHLVVGMYAPIALVLGAPVTLALGALPTTAARRITAVLRSRPVHLLARPATAVVLSAGGLWVLYATPLYGLTTTSPTAYTFVLVHLLLSGALLAWVLAGPDPAPHRPGTTPRLVALLVSAAAHAVLAKQLYARAGEWPPAAHGSVERVQEAAQLMYYGGDVAELLLAALVLRAWYVRAAPRAAPAAAAG